MDHDIRTWFETLPQKYHMFQKNTASNDHDTMINFMKMPSTQLVDDFQEHVWKYLLRYPSESMSEFIWFMAITGHPEDESLQRRYLIANSETQRLMRVKLLRGNPANRVYDYRRIGNIYINAPDDFFSGETSDPCYANVLGICKIPVTIQTYDPRIFIGKYNFLHLVTFQQKTKLLASFLAAHPQLVDSVAEVLPQHVHQEYQLRDATALHIAVANGYTKGTSILLKCGADPNMYCGEKLKSSLHIACRSLRATPTIMSSLIEHGASINQTDWKGWTPLIIAVVSNNKDAVQYLCDQHADLSYYGEPVGSQPLLGTNQTIPRPAIEHAVIYDHVECANILVRSGTDVNKALMMDWSEQMAIALCEPALDKRLATKHFVWTIHPDVLNSVLLYAISNGYATLVHKIVHLETDIVYSLRFDDAFRHACKKCNSDIIMDLLTLYEKIPFDISGDPSPLHMVVNQEIEHDKIVNMLCKAKVSVGERDQDGNTPLHIAAERGHILITKLLLKYNASACCQNLKGQTPLHLAAKGYTNICQLLLKAGGDQVYFLVDNDKNNVLHSAYESSCAHVIDALVQYNDTLLLQENEQGKIAFTEEDQTMWVRSMLTSEHPNFNEVRSWIAVNTIWNQQCFKKKIAMQCQWIFFCIIFYLYVLEHSERFLKYQISYPIETVIYGDPFNVAENKLFEDISNEEELEEWYAMVTTNEFMKMDIFEVRNTTSLAMWGSGEQRWYTDGAHFFEFVRKDRQHVLLGRIIFENISGILFPNAWTYVYKEYRFTGWNVFLEVVLGIIMIYTVIKEVRQCRTKCIVDFQNIVDGTLLLLFFAGISVHWYIMGSHLECNNMEACLYINELMQAKMFIFAVSLTLFILKMTEHLFVHERIVTMYYVVLGMVKELSAFIFVFLVFLISFASYEYIVIIGQRNYILSLLSIFRYTLTGIEMDDLSMLNMVFSYIFMFVMVLVIMNLFISVMLGAYEKTHATARLRWCKMQFDMLIDRKTILPL